jgi:arsenical pump membrane protein
MAGLTWVIAGLTILAILIRPRQWPEAIWACGGAAAMVLFRLLPVSSAWTAIRKGTDVYLFLAGMMLLAELARREGVFEWLASIAVSASKGSCYRLFGFVFSVGILVTVFLSNDATAVVLTPAVYAAIRRAKVEPLPYLFACAFIANAASFVLPISNPANLVIYGSGMPPLGHWLNAFLFPSIAAVVVTCLALLGVSRKQLAGSFVKPGDPNPLTPTGKRAAFGLAASAILLIAASTLNWDLGAVTCAAAFLAILFATAGRGIDKLIGGGSWSVLPLVAGLFVIVEALYGAGALKLAAHALRALSALPKASGSLLASFGIAGLSNIMNNLPSGLLTAGALQNSAAPEHIRRALLIGVDLGPNLSVTGSLATILWLVAVRREGENVTAWQFLKTGVVVMTPALLFSTLAIVLHWP